MRHYTNYALNDMRRYVSATNFGMILNNANARYNEAIWRRYATWDRPSDSREWIQGQKDTPILVRASVLGTFSPKPQRNGGGWKVYGGDIMKIGHGFSIDEDDLFEMRKQRALTGVPYALQMTEKVQDKSDAMIGGIHTELNYVTLQAMSTGEIHDVAVDGDRFDFKFPIDPKNFITVTSHWWAKDGNGKVVPQNVDVIQDILDSQKYLKDDLRLAVDHWKVSKEWFDRFIAHPRVIASAAGRIRGIIDTSNTKLTQSEILGYLHELGVWLFDVIDYQSAHEEDGLSVPDAPAFDEHNMVAASSLILPFTMKCTNSIYYDREKMGQIGDQHKYFLVEDRIMVLRSTEERPFKNIVDCELYAAPVFNNVREWGFLKTWSED